MSRAATPRTEADALREQLRAANQHIASLIALLKPVPPTVVAAPPAPPRVRSEVEMAIKEEAGSDMKLRQHFRNLARDLRGQGKSDGDIVVAVRSWDTTEAHSTED